MNIHLTNASKSYSRTTKALDELSIAFTRGDLVAVLGLNGAGKSTLLRAITGAIGLSSGKLLYDDKAFSYDDLDMRRKVLFIPDTPPLLYDETVLKNISIFLTQYQKTEEPGIADKVIKLLKAFEIVEKAETPAAYLSRGEAYKVGMVILAAIDPEVWILDEPFASGMDANGIRLFRELSSQAVENGSTVIYSTQLIDLAEGFANRVCLINKGKSYADVAPDELRSLAKEDHLISKLIGEG